MPEVFPPPKNTGEVCPYLGFCFEMGSSCTGWSDGWSDGGCSRGLFNMWAKDLNKNIQSIFGIYPWKQDEIVYILVIRHRKLARQFLKWYWNNKKDKVTV